MTRDSIPRDDLYGELEVSRQASVAAIEAAYRRLVKQHHPDVARSDDVERIKRLNLAREWLTDLDRRRRYDVSRGMSPTSAIAHHSPNGDAVASATRRRPGTPSGPAPDASSEPARSFGANANEVRIFLASLRGLDSERARRVFDGRAVAHAKGYSAARRVAAQIGQAERKTEWQLAREAASVIARGKLGDTTLTEQIVDVLADTAGAIAIRDLLPKSDYKTLLLPWTWKTARVVPARDAGPPVQKAKPAPPSSGPTLPEASAKPAAIKATPAVAGASVAPATYAAAPPAAEQATRRVSISELGASPWRIPPEPKPPWKSGVAKSRPVRAEPIPAVDVPHVSLPSLNPPRMRVPNWLAAGVTIAVFFAGGLLGIGRPPLEQGVAGLTDAPSQSSRATAFVVVPGQSIDETTSEPTATESADETPEPAATKRPGGGPGPGETKRPRPSPRPTPAPTPTPTLTPEPECIVPNLIGETASEAPAIWSAAGFTGLLTFDSPMQPNQRIGYQSLAAGSSEPCTSGIAVRKQG